MAEWSEADSRLRNRDSTPGASIPGGSRIRASCGQRRTASIQVFATAASVAEAAVEVLPTPRRIRLARAAIRRSARSALCARWPPWRNAPTTEGWRRCSAWDSHRGGTSTAPADTAHEGGTGRAVHGRTGLHPVVSPLRGRRASGTSCPWLGTPRRRAAVNAAGPGCRMQADLTS